MEQSEAIVNDAPDLTSDVERLHAAPHRASTPIKARGTSGRAPRNEVARASSRSAPADPPSVAEPARSPAPVAEVVEPPRIVDNQASRSVEPVGPLYDELVIAADSVIGLEIESRHQHRAGEG